MTYYEPRHFRIYELVPKSVYEALGARALLLFDPRILRAADLIRELFGVPCYVNDWMWSNGDGGNHYRGFRTAYCPVGAEYSQHRFGRALDIHVSGVHGEEARKVILSRQDRFFNGGDMLITRMETGVPHVHIDCANIGIGNGTIHLFHPSSQSGRTL